MEGEGLTRAETAQGDLSALVTCPLWTVLGFFPVSLKCMEGGLRKVKCPGKVCQLLLVVGPNLPVSGRKCAVAPVCKVYGVLGASPTVLGEVLKGRLVEGRTHFRLSEGTGFTCRLRSLGAGCGLGMSAAKDCRGLWISVASALSVFEKRHIFIALR